MTSLTGNKIQSENFFNGIFFGEIWHFNSWNAKNELQMMKKIIYSVVQNFFLYIIFYNFTLLYKYNNTTITSLFLDN